MNLFDSHSHYNDEKFDNDREKMIEETLQNGVSNFIVAGFSLESSKRAIMMANEHKELFAIVGISPNDLQDIKNNDDIINSINSIKELIIKDKNNKNKIVAVGEIGLDYYWDKEKKEIQKNMFIKQIELANEFNLPIVIHTRDATMDTIDILKKNNAIKRGIFHCCPLNIELIKEAIKLDFYISFSGIITFKNVKNVSEIINMIPEDRLLIETDSPYLTPEPLRGTRNNSMNVKYVAEKIANVKNKKIEDIALLTYNNARTIFDI